MECKRWKVIALLSTFVNLRLASIWVIPLLSINLYLISVTSDLTHFYFNSILDTITF